MKMRNTAVTCGCLFQKTDIRKGEDKGRSAKSTLLRMHHFTRKNFAEMIDNQLLYFIYF
jgi:hypothetical protein